MFHSQCSILTFEITDENSKKTYKADVNEKLNDTNKELVIILHEESTNSVSQMVMFSFI